MAFITERERSGNEGLKVTARASGSDNCESAHAQMLEHT